jgi:3-oxoacyl-[acyl-carrier-protein] synthase III
VIFSVSGGGVTIGTALYTLDDLPERMNGAPAARRSVAASASAPVRAAQQQVGVAAIGTAPRDGTVRDSIGLLGRAATECLRNAGAAHGDIDVLIFAGVYRTHFVNEPAMAALLAGAIGINATSAEKGLYTLAFDVMNGGVGVLNACWLGAELIRAGRAKRVLIVAGEVENNADSFRDHLLGVEETASALLLTATGDSGERFGGFHFESFPEHSEAFVSHLTNRDGQAWLRFHRDPALEQLYVSSAAQVVGRFLKAEQIDRTSIRRMFAPQISTGFLTVLADALAVPRAAVVDVVRAGFDLSTSSFAFALQHARREGVQAGDVGLIVSVGAGIEVGCALYHF